MSPGWSGVHAVPTGAVVVGGSVVVVVDVVVVGAAVVVVGAVVVVVVVDVVVDVVVLVVVVEVVVLEVVVLEVVVLGLVVVVGFFAFFTLVRGRTSGFRISMAWQRANFAPCGPHACLVSSPGGAFWAELFDAAPAANPRPVATTTAATAKRRSINASSERRPALRQR